MSDVKKNDMFGGLWHNERSKPTQPHFVGSCTVGGVDYWVSAWYKGSASERGDKDPEFSLSFVLKDDCPSTF